MEPHRVCGGFLGVRASRGEKPDGVVVAHRSEESPARFLAVGHAEIQDFGVELNGALYVADLEDDVAEFPDLDRTRPCGGPDFGFDLIHKTLLRNDGATRSIEV
jgi:hypothetical protein